MNRVRKWRVYVGPNPATGDPATMLYLDPRNPNEGRGDGLRFDVDDLTSEPGIDIRTWIVMDFTGLQDADGKDIYEGDIIESEYEGEPVLSPVVWGDGLAMFVFLIANEGNSSMAELPIGELRTSLTRVIGNVYQHPDLLNTANEGGR